MQQEDDEIRLKELKKYQLSFDTPESCFNELAHIARTSLKTRYSGISLVGQNNVWLKARLGIEATCLQREGAFCSHAIETGKEFYIIDNTLKHPFYKTHSLTLDLGVQFYAAAILRNNLGYPLGTIWVMDDKPRRLNDRLKTILSSLAAQVVRLLDLRYSSTATGLPNRKTFIESLQKLIAYDQDPSLAVVSQTKSTINNGVVGAIIIDNLDIINSIYGEEGVAQVHSELVTRLTHSFPNQAILAHIEESIFAFALLKRNNEQLIENFSEVKELLSACITIDTNEAVIQTSVGLVDFPENGNNAFSLLYQSLTSARRSKNNLIDYASKNSNNISDSRYIKALHKILQGDTNQNELLPFYQPQINTKDNTLSGLEALARWDSELLGKIAPDVFIVLAEESGLIAKLDILMFKKVCVDIEEWHQQGLDVPPVSVNFSRETLISDNIVILIDQILQAHNVAYHNVKIEITESTMISEYDPVLNKITALRALGILISIDDFGTGFSNLSILRLIKFDQLKVDRQFINDIAIDDSISGLFSFIKSVGSLFETNLMCEGMEKEEDVKYLMQKECYYHQGWYFSKALSASKIMLLLKETQLKKSVVSHFTEMARLLGKYQ